MRTEEIFSLERPHPSLLTLYVLRACAAGPFLVVLLPLWLFRYHTIRYRFDEQGIYMRWGLLFRREVNLTYARIQDIHLRSGPIQRWLGLADLLVQTASGSSGPEMTIEGFKQYDALRDFLYSRMRGVKDSGPPPPDRTLLAVPDGLSAGGASTDETVLGLLEGIRDELRATRTQLQARGRGAGSERIDG